MNILSFDTSGTVDSCTIYNSTKGILSEIKITNNKIKSENILEIIKLSLESTLLDLKDIDYIVTCIGPGSYTGVRIAIATTIGLSIESNIKVRGINYLDILAFASEKESITSFVISKSNEVHFSNYKRENGIFIRKSEYYKSDIKDFKKNNNLLCVTDKEVSIKSIVMDNRLLTNSTIMAKIIVNNVEKSLNPLEAFYFN